MLLPALLLAVVTTVTKVLTGWYAARRAGIGPNGRLRAGGALVARGEFSIVIAGLTTAVEPRIGPIATAYVLIMVILGPLTARWAAPVVNRARSGLLPLFGITSRKPAAGPATAPEAAPETTRAEKPGAAEASGAPEEEPAAREDAHALPPQG